MSDAKKGRNDRRNFVTRTPSSYYTIPATNSSSSSSSASSNGSNQSVGPISSSSTLAGGMPAAPTAERTIPVPLATDKPNYIYGSPEQEIALTPLLCPLNGWADIATPPSDGCGYTWILKNKLDYPVTLNCGVPKSDGSCEWNHYRFPNGDTTVSIKPGASFAVHPIKKLLWMFQWTTPEGQKYILLLETRWEDPQTN